MDAKILGTDSYASKLMNINIEIPDDIRIYIEAQVITGTYNSIEEYFLDLVQQDKKSKAQAKLEMLLLEGINSEAQEVTPEYWQNLHSVES
ncbi:type II toxin-antitoxin system ParD family antitoxin [Calothrix sp. PCC 7507]|uniref:ribbon-helix-helix domain-containing protein n=1 Tax=Calothrix sp. PCC 7507 TaxID=99598 RepID=UPI001F273E15|nr:type II toxin-antitoxin system ParD family antitoxin [Calothrix sp. PCC 7507]